MEKTNFKREIAIIEDFGNILKKFSIKLGVTKKLKVKFNNGWKHLRLYIVKKKLKILKKKVRSTYPISRKFFKNYYKILMKFREKL